MKLRPALIATFTISAIVRFLLGYILVAAQYEMNTLVYRYVVVFLGLGIIVTGFNKLWLLVGVFRFTR